MGLQYKIKIIYENLLLGKSHTKRELKKKTLQINTYGNMQAAMSEIEVYFHRDVGFYCKFDEVFAAGFSNERSGLCKGNLPALEL